ncbi:unnamed protein product (macronuclear) [Paramecium tetraurelia]|uniref:Transmembrane protein n=1 Tax=Paramecium tetraurelia TaxID=5888 RepID=A0C1U8_PARTE|nr:uncharacterized protein GSPATT00034242001 [Paramecium tetraurelia]CAK64765.1 unnamed protein product [Paramecium tetraurelia]|eukprot:XP_001432162.1 hypothetical protein (macronuclear) [Paramecium tetraurelia strain d4-2]
MINCLFYNSTKFGGVYKKQCYIHNINGQWVYNRYQINIASQRDLEHYDRKTFQKNAAYQRRTQQQNYEIKLCKGRIWFLIQVEKNCNLTLSRAYHNYHDNNNKSLFVFILWSYYCNFRHNQLSSREWCKLVVLTEYEDIFIETEKQKRSVVN